MYSKYVNEYTGHWEKFISCWVKPPSEFTLYSTSPDVGEGSVIGVRRNHLCYLP